MRSILYACLLAVAAIGFARCGEPSAPARNRVASATVTPALDTLRALGQTVQLQASGLDRSGHAVGGARPRWSSSNAGVARVDTAGLVTAVSNGEADVAAAYDTVRAIARIVVRQAAATAKLTPEETTATAFGQRIHFTLTSWDAAGARLDGRMATWASSDTLVATVSADGTATARKNGITYISGTVDGVGGSAKLVVDVRGALLVRLTTSGGGVDKDGYTVLVGSATQPAGDDGVFLVEGLPAGPQPVSLGGVASHCRPAPDRTSVEILPADTVELAIDVRCIGRYAYVDWAGGPYELRYMDEFGVSRQLAAGPVERYTYAWSPDGGRIVFARQVSGNTDVYVVRPDGTGLVRLTNHPDSDGTPSWSPDGEQIAYRSTAPDGRVSVWVVRADGSNPRHILDLPQEVFTYGPAWSPRGDVIVMTSTLTGRTPVQVLSVAPDGTGLHPLVSHGYLSIQPVWAPDGQQLAFSYAGPESDGWRLHVVAPDGTGEREVANSEQGPLYPAWSPDGKRLAFMKNVGGRYGVYTVNADGSGEAYLTPDLGFGADVAWSTDGRYLLFGGSTDGILGVMVMDADGGRRQLLTPGRPGSQQGPLPRPQH